MEMDPPTEYTDAQRAMKVRQRLGQLTRWPGQAIEPSVAVARAIGVTLDTLFPHDHIGADTNVKNVAEKFSWFLKVQLHDKKAEKFERIEFHAYKSPGGRWKADGAEIEAAVSLWLFHIHEMRAISLQEMVSKGEAAKGSGTENDWLEKDVELSQKIVRLLGPGDTSLRRDIGWWIGNDVGLALHLGGLPRDEIVGTKDTPKGFPGFSGPIGFLGLESEEQSINIGKFSNVRSHLIMGLTILV